MKRLLNYLSQSRIELSKVDWPSRRAGIRLTLNVVVFSIVLAIFIGILDYAFTFLLQKIILKG